MRRKLSGRCHVWPTSCGSFRVAGGRPTQMCSFISVAMRFGYYVVCFASLLRLHQCSGDGVKLQGSYGAPSMLSGLKWEKLLQSFVGRGPCQIQDRISVTSVSNYLGHASHELEDRLYLLRFSHANHMCTSRAVLAPRYCMFAFFDCAWVCEFTVCVHVS